MTARRWFLGIAMASMFVSTTWSPSRGQPIAVGRGDRTGPRAVTLVAAADIACDPRDPAFRSGRGIGDRCRATVTAKVAERLDPDVVVTLGDEQYVDGRGAAFRTSYDASWGRFSERVRPVPGNHEYWADGTARGYFSYFGLRAGLGRLGWYSFGAGTWHVVALNSNCDRIACGPDSPQVDWLRTDLASSSAACTLALLHHPLVSSGPHGDDPLLTRSLWRVLYAAGVDVALTGHDHLYERFAPLRPDLSKDPATGIRTFVVGTGGVGHYPVVHRRTFSQLVNPSTFGVLRLVLRPDSYRWRFVPAPGGSFTDAGSDRCH